MRLCLPLPTVSGARLIDFPILNFYHYFLPFFVPFLFYQHSFQVLQKHGSPREFLRGGWTWCWWSLLKIWSYLPCHTSIHQSAYFFGEVKVGLSRILLWTSWMWSCPLLYLPNQRHPNISSQRGEHEKKKQFEKSMSNLFIEYNCRLQKYNSSSLAN